MLVVVGFQLVARMVMFMGAVVAGVVMIMHVAGPLVGNSLYPKGIRIGGPINC